MILLKTGDSGNRNSFPIRWSGGTGTLRVNGALNGGTVTLWEASVLPFASATDSSKYEEHGQTISTDDSAANFSTGRGMLYVALTGSGGSDAADISIDEAEPGQHILKFTEDLVE